MGVASGNCLMAGNRQLAKADRCHAPEMKAAGMVWRHKSKTKSRCLIAGNIYFFEAASKSESNRNETKSLTRSGPECFYQKGKILYRGKVEGVRKSGDWGSK